MPPVANSASVASTVDNTGHALFLFRNSHSTALARLVDQYGARKRNESDRALIAICWMYAQYCECDKPNKPIIWRMADGAQSIFAARGYRHTRVTEKCLRTENDADRAQWAEVTGSIDGNQPVIVSFCYDPAAAKGLALAKRRESKCFSALAIGHVTSGGRHYLICHDGLAAGQSSVAAVDKVSPQSIGLSPLGVWSQPGTGIYRWEGTASNLVFVFVGAPQR